MGLLLIILALVGGLYRDHLGTFLGAFACNLGRCSVFDAEVSTFILALEFAAQHGWITFGWKVTLQVRFLFSKIHRLSLFFFETGGVMHVLLIFKSSSLIFSGKATCTS